MPKVNEIGGFRREVQAVLQEGHRLEDRKMTALENLRWSIKTGSSAYTDRCKASLEALSIIERFIERVKNSKKNK